MTDQPTAQSSTLRWLPVLVVVVLVLLLFLQLRDILMPFAVGALIAYLGDPLVDRFEARGVTRTSGVALVFALLMVILVIIAAVVVPVLIQQLSQLAAAIPDAYRWVSEVAVPKLQSQLSLSPVSYTHLTLPTTLVV